jgi:MSHA biogenesis protein MshM
LTFGEGKQEVAARHIKAAARDTGAARKVWWSWAWMGSMALLVAISGMGWVYFK